MEVVDGTGITADAVQKMSLPMGFAIRIPAGRDAEALYQQYSKVISDTINNMTGVSRSIDFEDGQVSAYSSQV